MIGMTVWATQRPRLHDRLYLERRRIYRRSRTSGCWPVHFKRSLYGELLAIGATPFGL